MWNEPTEKQLAKLPKLYETENVPTKDKKVLMHFFIGSCDWYVTEYSPEDRLFFGWACLGDLQNAEWGYISLDELKELKVKFMEVDRDLHFVPCKISEIPLMNGGVK